MTARDHALSPVLELAPGLAVCAVAAAAAGFLSEHYGAPIMLFALLLGLALNFLSDHPRCSAGIEFGARTLLRLGVALLALRITFGQVSALGWMPTLLVTVSVGLTIGMSMLAARWLGFSSQFGLLSGGATAICGASAAMALAAALPPHPLKERATVFTVVGVSALSTLAMVLYPMLTGLLAPDARHAGIFLGATIHDVAQVVGAGYSLSAEAGDVATVVKLMRVALLMPVIGMAVWIGRRQTSGVGGRRPPLLPGFAVGFVVLLVANSLLHLPQNLTAAGSTLSRVCLVAAIAAIGMKTKLQELATVGWRPVTMMLGETVFLAGLVAVLLAIARATGY